MTEPCPRCPKFVVRCGHLGEAYVVLRAHTGEDVGLYSVTNAGESRQHTFCLDGLTRAEADAEFDRREEALLA